MQNITTIKNVRAYLDENGTAQINLEDAARGLGFTDGNSVRWARVRNYLDDFGYFATSGDGLKLESGPEAFIPENIFYRLAMKAKNETAIQFQNQVASEILPSIRKHGAYMTPDTLEKAILSPDFLIQLATKLKEEQTARIEAEAKLQLAAPKAEAWEVVAEDEGFLMTAGEIAKTVALPGLNESNVRQCFRELNILCTTKNELTADALRKGFGREVVSTIDTGYKIIPIKTPKFRGKAIDMAVRHWKQTHGVLF